MKPGGILVVDDEADLRLAIGMLVRRVLPGWRVEAAGDGEEGRRKVVELRPRLLILDLYMPGMGGLELCRFVQRDLRCRGTRILVLTGHPSQRVREEAFECGAVEFLRKPFDAQELMESVMRLSE